MCKPYPKNLRVVASELSTSIKYLAVGDGGYALTILNSRIVYTYLDSYLRTLNRVIGFGGSCWFVVLNELCVLSSFNSS